MYADGEITDVLMQKLAGDSIKKLVKLRFWASAGCATE